VNDLAHSHGVVSVRVQLSVMVAHREGSQNTREEGPNADLRGRRGPFNTSKYNNSSSKAHMEGQEQGTDTQTLESVDKN